MLWKLGGLNSTAGESRGPPGRTQTTCQGEGRGFESRLPLKGPSQSGFVKLLAAMTRPNRDGAIAKFYVEGSSVRVVSREPLSDCLAGAPRFRRVPQFRSRAHLFDSVACAWDAIDRRDSRPSDR